MPNFDIYDVFCFTGVTTAVGATFDFSTATLLDPETITANDYLGQPLLRFQGDPSPSQFGGSDATFLNTMQMDVTMTDGTTQALTGYIVQTADGNDYVIFKDSAGDFEASSGVVTSLSQGREPILSGVGTNNDQTGGTPPCFTPQSLIMTQTGLCQISTLNEGDLIQTRDNGFQAVKWIYQRDISYHWMRADPSLLPVVITKCALGPNTPNRDMTVSPGHLVLLRTPATAAGPATEILVPARQLVNRDGVYRAKAHTTAYLHLLFDQHQVVFADNCWSESFQPGKAALNSIGQHARDEIFTLFPELAYAEYHYAAARDVLYRKAAKDAVLSLHASRSVQ